MKKYDFVKVIDFYRDDEDAEYTEVGKRLIGEYAMVINRDKRCEGHPLEICFFDMELQKLAMDNGFDYWDETELEVI